MKDVTIDITNKITLTVKDVGDKEDFQKELAHLFINYQHPRIKQGLKEADEFFNKDGKVKPHE